VIGAQTAQVSSLLDSPWIRGPMVYLVALGLQMSLFADVRIGGAAADIMLGLAIGAGLVAGPERGVLTAFLIGILYDLLLTTPFGLSALAYTLSAWIVARFTDRLLRHVWWFTMLVGMGASALGVLLYATAALLFGVDQVFTWDLVTIVAVVAIVNGLLMPVVLRVQRWTLTAGRS
jgi:rod shape-determining protein MreD